MKKILLFVGFVFISLIILFISTSKFSVKQKTINIPIEQSSFYKEFYDSNDLILINVWATHCAPCIAEFPEFEQFHNNPKLKFISFSIDNDTLKLKKFLENKPFVKNRDVTLKNFKSLNEILNIIDLTGVSNDKNIISFGATIIPYTVLIKNKKILFSTTGSELIFNELKRIIVENQ